MNLFRGGVPRPGQRSRSIGESGPIEGGATGGWPARGVGGTTGAWLWEHTDH